MVTATKVSIKEFAQNPPSTEEVIINSKELWDLLNQIKHLENTIQMLNRLP